MEKGNYSSIVNVLMNIVDDEKLANIVFVSGGIVPWLVSKKNSNRNHGDIDILVANENMPVIRDFLLKHNLYDASLDSLNYDEAKMTDYGIDTYIGGIPVGFYPYEQMTNGSIIQKSFSPTEVNGRKDLKIKKISNIEITDYLSRTTLPNGNEIGISSLEIIKVTKEKAGREKDIYDIKEIDRIGYDFNRYKRVKNSINNIESIFNDRIIGQSMQSKYL